MTDDAGILPIVRVHKNFNRPVVAGDLAQVEQVEIYKAENAKAFELAERASALQSQQIQLTQQVADIAQQIVTVTAERVAIPIQPAPIPIPAPIPEPFPEPAPIPTPAPVPISDEPIIQP
jgi:acyl-CoA thioesterase FadM